MSGIRTDLNDRMWRISPVGGGARFAASGRPSPSSSPGDGCYRALGRTSMQHAARFDGRLCEDVHRGQAQPCHSDYYRPCLLPLHADSTSRSTLKSGVYRPLTSDIRAHRQVTKSPMRIQGPPRSRGVRARRGRVSACRATRDGVRDQCGAPGLEARASPRSPRAQGWGSPPSPQTGASHLPQPPTRAR